MITHMIAQLASKKYTRFEYDKTQESRKNYRCDPNKTKKNRSWGYVKKFFKAAEIWQILTSSGDVFNFHRKSRQTEF